MARKLPKLDHVKYVHRRGRVYAYFNTGQTHQVVEHYAAQVNRRRLGKSAILKFEAARKNNA